MLQALKLAMLLKKWKKRTSISNTSNILSADCAESKKNPSVLKTPGLLRTRHFPAKIGNMYPFESDTRSGKNQKEVPSRGNFCDQGSDGYKKNIVACFSGSHTNCAERSLACYAHLESFSTQLHPYGSKSGYRRPPQAEISHEQVPVYKDFELLDYMLPISVKLASQSFYIFTKICAVQKKF